MPLTLTPPREGQNISWSIVPKRTATNIGCGFFDKHDLQSLNNYKICFFGLATKILGIWGHVKHFWQVFENTFPIVYSMPPTS
jgi:hypothetical protein